MFTANIEGLQQLKDGTVKFTLTCPEDQLVTVSEYRKKGKVTVMGADEAPVTDSRVTVLTNLHSVAVQIAEAIDRELSQEIVGGDIDANIYTDGTDGQMSIIEGGNTYGKD